MKISSASGDDSGLKFVIFIFEEFSLQLLLFFTSLEIEVLFKFESILNDKGEYIEILLCFLSF